MANPTPDEETHSGPDREDDSVEWGFWVQWVLASTVGWVAGWALTGPTGIGIGVTLGIAQWLVLRQLIRDPGWWIWASTVGWAVGWALITTGVVIPPGAGQGLSSVIAGVTFGAATGVAQALILRRYLYQAGWWIFASIVGWTVGLPGVLGQTIVGAVVGALTGFMLDWLRRHPRSETTTK